MGNFATIQDLEDFLQLEISTADEIASANRALEEATAAIQNYCNQFIEEVLDDVIILDVTGSTNRLFLPELPVNGVSLVVEDGETLTADDDYQLGQWGILYRVDREWVRGIQIVTITYSHGYYDIPDDIVAVATRAASRAYQAGLKAADTAGVPGVASKSLGDFSVAYQSAAGGGVGEGLMGASGFRPLLLSEKDLLNRYRVKGP